MSVITNKKDFIHEIIFLFPFVILTTCGIRVWCSRWLAVCVSKRVMRCAFENKMRELCFAFVALEVHCVGSLNVNQNCNLVAAFVAVFLYICNGNETI